MVNEKVGLWPFSDIGSLPTSGQPQSAGPVRFLLAKSFATFMAVQGIEFFGDRGQRVRRDDGGVGVESLQRLIDIRLVDRQSR